MELRWMGALGASVVACALFAGTAHADARVAWDCYLPDAGVGCRDVASAFFASVPGVTRAAEDEAPLAIRLRATAMSRGRRYLAQFHGTPFAGEAGQEPVAFSLSEQVPDAAGRDRTLMLLVALLQRGTVPYLHVTTPGKSEGGVLALEASSAAGAVSDAATSATSNEGWYGRPSVGGEIVSAGVRVVSIEAELELGWSHPSWRFLLSGSASYRHLDLELPGSRLRGGFVQARSRTVLARTLGSGFGLGVVGSARREPQNNLESRVEAGVGLEWLHRDFLRADEGNFGARYAILGAWDRYSTTTVHGQARELYARHSLTLFARLHLDAIDVDFDVTGGAVADRPHLWDVGGELSVTVRVADGLEVALSAATIYRGGAVHEPEDASLVDPVAIAVAGSDFGELTYTAGLSLAYSFGNGLIRAQDQRFR